MKARESLEDDTEKKWERFVAGRDPELRQQLILQYVHLVNHVVHRMGFDGSPPFDKEDLISDGILGLISAVDRFDPGRGIQFATYATIRIRGQILDALRTRDLLPRPARRRVKQLQDAVTALIGTLGAPPTEEELAEYLNLTLDQLRQTLMDASFEIWSMDAPLSDDGEGFCLQNVLKSPDESQPAVRQEMTEVRDQIRDAFRQLPHRQRVLLSLYYYEELTMKDVGKVLGISESRVSQLHAQAILSLRSLLRSAGVVVARKEPSAGNHAASEDSLSAARLP
ncbi:MAG TPA: FliA/WhiG family RNA polymerase sigma factor [Anaerolineae bacterium]|nr:FliA/WhiG family RNA polymerase sigma factor [Anaerolineae bacterium]